MLKFNLKESLANANLHIISRSLLGRCLDLVDRRGASCCSGVGDCCEISWC